MKVTFKNTEHCKGSKEIKREVKKSIRKQKEHILVDKKEKQNNKIKRNYKIVLQKMKKKKKHERQESCQCFGFCFQ